jgi:tetratricopeptide (TPR) repeat protein
MSKPSRVLRTVIAAAALITTPAAMLPAQSAIIMLPDISQHARSTQRIGLTDITVDYHRPAVAGRKIFGALQPYGDVWRAGANYNTTIELTDSVRVEGHPLGRGIYGLHMIPGASSWVVIFSKNATSWGSFTYDSTEDALRVTVTPVTIPLQEMLTYDFDSPRANSVALTMKWERVAVPIRIDVDVPHLVAASLRNQLRGRVQTEWQAWEESANYLLENGLDADEALRYANQSTQIEDRFENEITKARALTALQRPAEAKTVQAKALSLGTQTQVYNFARTLQRLGQQDAGLEIFRRDVQRDSTSVYGHLEATRIAVAAHDFDRAIKECVAALAIAPPGLKSSIDGLIAELRQGVDINR